MQGGTVAVTATAQQIVLDVRHLLVINDGTDVVYIKIEDTTDTADVVTATVADFMTLASGEFMVLDTEKDIKSLQLVCAGGETASVRYSAWR